MELEQIVESEEVDTTEYVEPPRFAIYKLYDAEDTLLYVGRSANVGARLAAHEAEKPWWSSVANIEIQRYSTSREAVAAERHLITWLRPLYNKQHNWFRQVQPDIAPVSRKGWQ